MLEKFGLRKWEGGMWGEGEEEEDKSGAFLISVVSAPGRQHWLAHRVFGQPAQPSGLDSRAGHS